MRVTLGRSTNARLSQVYLDSSRGFPHARMEKSRRGYPRGRLSEAERVALNLYTDSGMAGRVNEALRQAVHNPAAVGPLRPFVGVLEAALAKLPFHAGPVNRGVRLRGDDPQKQSEALLSRYPVGAVVNDLHFTCTSRNPANRHLRDAHVVFHIESRRGRHIAPWSRQPWEDEVLFPTDALFAVIEVLPGPPLAVVMREVE